MNHNENKEKMNDESVNYQLSSDAVETLANADKEPVPQYSEEELKKYRKKKFHIPMLAKVLFFKAWFSGAVCYFVLMGLGMYLHGLDMYFVLVLVMGMVTDLLTNNVIRFIEELPGENDKYLLVTKKGMVGLGLNLLFSTVVTVLVVMLYEYINIFFAGITGQTDKVFLPVEPILFGAACMGLDMLLIGIKRLCLSIFRDAKAAAAGQSNPGNRD